MADEESTKPNSVKINMSKPYFDKKGVLHSPVETPEEIEASVSAFLDDPAAFRDRSIQLDKDGVEIKPGRTPQSVDQGSFIPDDQPQASFQPDPEPLASGSFVPDEPDTSAMKTFVKENLKKASEEKAKREPVDTSLKPVPAEDWLDALAAGWGTSVSGLISRGETSPLAVTEDAGRMVKIASQIGTIAGDVPAMIAGGVLGGLAAAPTAAVTGPIGPTMGADFGANALPSAMRKIMMDHYERGDITTASEFMDRLSATTWETIKGGVIGVATMGAGRVAGPVVGRAGGGVATQALAKTASEIGTMVSVSSAMEGHLPNSDDFINAGIVIGGLGASLKVASKLRNRFVETGELPHQTVEAAGRDVVLKQELAATNDRSVAPPSPELPKDLMETPPSKLAAKWDEFYTKTSNGYQRALDDLASFRMAKDALAEGKDIPAGSDPYILARNYKGIETVAHTFESQRTFDFKTGKVNGESLHQIYRELPRELSEVEPTEAQSKILSRIDPDEVKGKDNAWKQLNSYRVAKRALELNGRGIETGIDVETAREVVNAGQDKLEPIVKRVQEWSDRALQYFADSGGVSKEELKFIRAMNQDYVPFHRLLEDDPFSVKGAKGTGLRRIKGSSDLLQDPERVMRENVKALIKMAEKNRIYNRLVDLQESAPEGAPKIMQKKSASQYPIEVQQQEVARFLRKHGVEEDSIPPEGLTIFRPKQDNLQSNEFQFKREATGKREVWQILPEYADAVKALGYRPAEMNIFTKLATYPAKALRTGTALSPDFILRNIWRDQLTATVQSKYSQLPFVDALKSVGSMWKNDEAWQSFLQSGAFSGGIGNLKGFLDGDLYSLNKETGFIDSAWNVVRHPIHALEIFSTYAENVPRFTEFRKSGAVGGTFDDMVRGGFAAREVTVDFQRAGETARKYSPLIPFMNVGLQGTDRFIRRFKENPKQTLALATATMTLPSVINWFNNRDDSRYKSAPAWQKHLFWLIPTDHWEQAASKEDWDSRPSDLKRVGSDGRLEVNNGIVLRLPKPFEVGILFGTLPELALDAFYRKDPSAFKEFDNTVIQAFIPNVAPTAAVGIAEHLSNHSFFLDSDLVSPHQEQFLPEDRYSSYTSETAKQIAKIIGYVPYLRDLGSKATPLQAPAVVDNYLQVWGGTGGKYLVQLSDSLLKATGISNKPEKPAWTWGDTPFVKAFVMKNPSAKTETIREFYERYGKAQQVFNSLKESVKRQDQDRYEEIKAVHGENLIRLTGVYKALGDANKVLNNLQNSDVGLDGEKRDPRQRTQLMTTTYYQMNKMAESALQIMDEMEKKK